jgi:Na+/phosphate symporter
LASIKHDIEQLRSQDSLKDTSIQIHQQIQECVKLCDSAKTMLTDEYQKLEAKHKELLKENKELNTQLEMLKQTKPHN